MHRDQPGQQYRKVQLSEDGFEVSHAAGERVNRQNVAITGRSQCRETETQHVTDRRDLRLVRRNRGKAVRIKLLYQTENRSKDHRDIQIQNDGAFDPMVRYTT